MEYYIYKFSDNWADEMDIEGFAILTENQKDIALAKIKREFKKGGTLYFGNEENEYSDLDEVMNCIEISSLTSQQYHILKNVFPNGHIGQLGPLDFDSLGDYFNVDEYENEEADEEEEYEQLYYSQAKKIEEFVKNEYGLEVTDKSNSYSRFLWKPTNKTEIEITIQDYQDGNEDEEVELTLRLNGKEMRYDFFTIDDICDRLEFEFKEIIKEYIEKAKKY